MEKIEVTGCPDCPFRDEIERSICDDEGYEDDVIVYYCKHPKRYLVDLYENDNGIVTPSDCPLLKGPTEVSIKQ